MLTNYYKAIALFFSRGLPIIGLLVLVVIGFRYCKLHKNKNGKFEFTHSVLGKTYVLQYSGVKDCQEELTCVLHDVVQAIDHRQENSEITQFNRHNCTSFSYRSPFLYPILQKVKNIHEQTAGLFDPTVTYMLGKASSQETAAKLHALQQRKYFIGLQYLVVNEKRIKKLKEKVYLRLDAIEEGCVMDALVQCLEENGISDFCLQTQNRAMVRGEDSNHIAWEVGMVMGANPLIETPYSIKVQGAGYALAVIDTASVEEAKEHLPLLVDPRTLEIPASDILAGLVFAEDNITANAYATVMRMQNYSQILPLLQRLPNIKVFLVYKDSDGHIHTYHSPTLQTIAGQNAQELVFVWP